MTIEWLKGNKWSLSRKNIHPIIPVDRQREINENSVRMGYNKAEVRTQYLLNTKI
jgi:hypothetical protein